MSIVTLAIPSKGRLKDQVEAWLADCGFKLEMTGGARGYSAELSGLPGVSVRLLSAGDIAAGLDERLGAVRGELREALSEEIAAALDERLGGVAEGAQKAAREEAQALGEVLSGRIEALETDRIDPDELAQKIRDALLADLPDAAAMERLAAKPERKDLDDAVDALRKELNATMEKSVPKVAATVIREEIAALLKDFS